ncbi:Tex family protein [uncultured Selenomonas sp.]|uniref:Tex family protein n=1 Tax=uncultured Selenomonas sp. TaxID=159275 RepID=UPI0028D40542|nr:Tex family protein [uncultured Selenomonas sp.]
MKEENIGAAIARALGIRAKQAEATIALLDEGNTVPFISRYRKEATGELDEEQVRSVESELSRLRNLVKRQQEIEKSIEEQGKLTPEIKEALDRALKMQELEDIYLPFKQKRRTRAGVAREKGLEPLALAILAQEEKSGTAEEYAAQFIDAEKGVETAEDALSGAMDIVAETVSEGAALRQKMRKELWQRAELVTALDEEAEEAQTFLMYQDYKEPLRTLPSHRILAINRGEKKGCLKVTLQCDHEKLAAEIFDGLAKSDSIFRESLKAAIEDGYKRLLFPAMERELRALLTENAEKQAIHVFGANLKQLLLEAPLAGHTVMGLDPGYRTGCKMAVVSPTGQVVDHGVLYLTMSEERRAEAAKKVLALIKKHGVTLISIGNGTASYETEEFTANLIRENKLPVHYLITNEAGASVYSASKLAKEELPEYDVTIRGAVSIARRVQDPLAELVKIDPQAIGVGQYQHDVNQKELAAALDAVVESAVNHVGVNLNTASATLLSHIAGVTKAIAKNIVDWRDENGVFANRRQLLKVPRLGPAAFTQCAGFLRIAGGKSPLDNTPVHPESYALAEKLLDRLGFSLDDLSDKKALETLGAKLRLADAETLAKELAAGVPTMRDIIDALKKPGRDPREDLPAPLTRQAIVKLSDIKAGAVMRGTVRNITDFGVFVDIGIKTAGLIHISELSKKRVKHPLDVVSVGDIVNVMVIKVDEERGRIGLSLKQVPKEAAI